MDEKYISNLGFGDGETYKLKDEDARNSIKNINGNIKNINGNIENMTENIENMTENIENINNEIGELHNSINYHNYPGINGEKTRYFIDGINGNDGNIGTEVAPFKTIDKFFELLNQGYTDIRCNIVSSGTYTASKTILSNCTIHISALTPGVIIEFQNTNVDSCVYNTHLNFDGYDSENHLVLRNSDNTKTMYFENCATSLTNVTIENCSEFNIIGGFLLATTIKVPSIYLNGCNSDIYSLEITDTTSRNNITYRQGSNGVLRGTLKYANDVTTRSLLVIERSILTFHPTVTNNSVITSAPAISSTYGILHTTDTYLNYFSNLSDSDNYFNQTALMKGNIILEN